MSFSIKICGITRPEDAVAAAEAGADAIGLNFYPKSPRCVSLEQARAIVDVLPAGVAKVGVFVNATSCSVSATAHRLGLDLVQLHGDESPEYLAELGGLEVVRAFRCGPDGLTAVHTYLGRCQKIGWMPRMVLCDAYQQDAYGGTGKVVDWEAVANYNGAAGLPALVLAGGLTPENVGEAIRIVRPAGVDTASGVELQPGVKDPDRTRRFVEAAREAFASLGD
jgi:phosphoribosylanthranilate isomerase